MAIGTSLAGTASALYDPTNPTAERLYVVLVGAIPLTLGLAVARSARRHPSRSSSNEGDYGVSAPPVSPKVSPEI